MNDIEIATHIVEQEKRSNLMNSLNVLEGRLKRSGADEDSMYVGRARMALWALQMLLEGYQKEDKDGSD